jgi:predicted CxxxxCH...CXXCH cytochrome family protein
VNAGVVKDVAEGGCSACHVDPRIVTTTTTHGNNVVNVVFGVAAQDPASAATPVWNASARTCSNVYCHAQGGSVPAPAWTQTISGCGACHPAPGAIHGGAAANQCVLCHPANAPHVDGTVNVSVAGHDASWATTNARGVTPHGLAANYQNKAAFPTGFDGCRACHGSNLDNPVITTVPSCDSCHTNRTAAWRTSCTFCHGDAARAPASYQLADAAPPFDVQGSPTGARVGAHQAHLFGDARNTPQISAGVACDDCHGGTARTLPTSFEPHANGTTEVTLKRPGQTGASTGTYDPATGTCSNTYCHGNLVRNPKPGNSPSWRETGASSQTDCGTCHAANGTYGGADATTGRHDIHRCASCHGNSATNAFSTQVGCFACHAGYQRQLGTTALTPPTVNVTVHVDGAVQVATTATLLNGFALSTTYVPPGASTPASCTTNCHGIPEHGVPNPTTSKTW